MTREQPSPHPALARPRWVQNMRLLGAAVVVAAFATAIMDTIEWRMDVAGVAIFVCVSVTALLANDWIAERFYRKALAARLTAEQQKLANVERQSAFIHALKREAAYTAVCDYPWHGADILRMLSEHDLLEQAETECLIEEARARCVEEHGADPMYRTGSNGRGAFGRLSDEEIPF